MTKKQTIISNAKYKEKTQNIMQLPMKIIDRRA